MHSSDQWDATLEFHAFSCENHHSFISLKLHSWLLGPLLDNIHSLQSSKGIRNDYLVDSFGPLSEENKPWWVRADFETWLYGPCL